MTEGTPVVRSLGDPTTVGSSGFEAAWCYQCGVCTATCPWGLVREQAPGVRRLVRAAQLGLAEADAAAWLCTACAQCEAACPRQVPIVRVLQSLREQGWDQRKLPKGLPSVLWSMHWNRNPWSQPPSKRMRWADGLGLQPYDANQHEILLYVGCTASYDPRAQRIARALVRVLRSAGVTFGVLGENEPCCGDAALSLGHRTFFDEIAGETAATLRDRGVKSFVTISPHAFDVFRHHYGLGADDPRPIHYSTFLDGLIQDKRLRLPRSLPRKLTYHDPCLLGRHNQIYEEPRRVLEAIPDATLVEMERNRDEALCCGGGGGRIWMDTPPAERLANLRIAEATATGADILVTACAFCAACLRDSLRGGPGPQMQILDLAEVVDLAIDDASVSA